MPRLSHIRKFGRNSDVDTAAEETIWEGGGDYSWLSSADTLNVVSSSANDDSAGTGDLHREFHVPVLCPAKSDIEFRGSTSANNTGISIEFDANLVKVG